MGYKYPTVDLLSEAINLSAIKGPSCKIAKPCNLGKWVYCSLNCVLVIVVIVSIQNIPLNALCAFQCYSYEGVNYIIIDELANWYKFIYIYCGAFLKEGVNYNSKLEEQDLIFRLGSLQPNSMKIEFSNFK